MPDARFGFPRDPGIVPGSGEGPCAKAGSYRRIRHSPDAVGGVLRRALGVRDRIFAAGCQDQEGSEVSTVRYVGHGVEIEDDAVRLRRRKMEFDGDAARRFGQGKPPRRTGLGPVRAISAALARWR